MAIISIIECGADDRDLVAHGHTQHKRFNDLVNARSPDDFTDPVYLPRWLQEYDPTSGTMPLVGTPT